MWREGNSGTFYILHCDRYEEAREKLIPDMSLLSRSIRLSLRVLLTVGEDNRLTETERLRLLAQYIENTEPFNL